MHIRQILLALGQKLNLFVSNHTQKTNKLCALTILGSLVYVFKQKDTFGKGGSVEETLGINSYHTANLNFTANELRVRLL